MSIFRRGLNGRAKDLIRRGTGVHEARWQLNGRPDRLEALAGEIVEWVRLSMGEMRRPYGIDQVALALSCRDSGGNVVGSSSLGIMRPDAFYRDEGEHRVAAFLHGIAGLAAGRPGEIGAALLSVGDLAYELGAAKAA